MQIVRTRSNDLAVNVMPDGSKVIVDAWQQKVFALNSTAGAAWEACSSRTTLSRVTAEMQRTLNPQVSEEIAEEAILQLQEQNLVITAGASSTASRREVPATLGNIPLPVVVLLSMTDRRAKAKDTVYGANHTGRL